MITKYFSFEYIFHLNSTISKVSSALSYEKSRVSRVLFRDVLKMESFKILEKVVADFSWYQISSDFVK